jgi:hypothetical protein
MEQESERGERRVRKSLEHLPSKYETLGSIPHTAKKPQNCQHMS